MTASVLDEVPGVGEGRKRALLKAFGSMRGLRKAALEEIEAVPGIPARVAADVYGTLRSWEEELGRARAAGRGSADG